MLFVVYIRILLTCSTVGRAAERPMRHAPAFLRTWVLTVRLANVVNALKARWGHKGL